MTTTTTSRPTTPARRSFLALLAGAATAPTAAALPAAAATTAPTEPAITESPELLALGERLEATIAELKHAATKKAEARAVYERTKPPVTADLIAGLCDRQGQLSDRLLDLDYKPVRGERGEPLEIFSARHVRAQIILRQINGRSSEGRRLHRLARLADKYEKADDAAIEASGYETWNAQEHAAGAAAFDLAIKLADMQPLTIEGAKVYANVLLVFIEIGCAAGYAYSPKETQGALARGLAAAMLRIADQGVAA